MVSKYIPWHHLFGIRKWSKRPCHGLASYFMESRCILRIFVVSLMQNLTRCQLD